MCAPHHGHRGVTSSSLNKLYRQCEHATESTSGLVRTHSAWMLGSTSSVGWRSKLTMSLTEDSSGLSWSALIVHPKSLRFDRTEHQPSHKTGNPPPLHRQKEAGLDERERYSKEKVNLRRKNNTRMYLLNTTLSMLIVLSCYLLIYYYYIFPWIRRIQGEGYALF